MQIALIVAVSLHVLSAVAWAGFTFALARTSGASLERLVGPQMGSGAVAVLSGGWLASMTHRGAFGLPEKVLALGVGAALLAYLIQIAIAAPAARKLKRDGDLPDVRRRGARAEQFTAALLVLTIVCMGVTRYV